MNLVKSILDYDTILNDKSKSFNVFKELLINDEKAELELMKKNKKIAKLESAKNRKLMFVIDLGPNKKDDHVSVSVKSKDTSFDATSESVQAMRGMNTIIKESTIKEPNVIFLI